MKNSSKSIKFNTTNLRLPRQVPPNSSSGDGDDSSPSPSLYIFVFLITLVLLLTVSAAVVARSWYLRRRAQRLGLAWPQSQGLFGAIQAFRRTSTNSDQNPQIMSLNPLDNNNNNNTNIKKPEMFEISIEQNDVKRGLSVHDSIARLQSTKSNTWDAIRPFGATLSVPQSMASALKLKQSCDGNENNDQSWWHSPSNTFMRLSQRRSRFWPPVYRGRDNHQDQRRRLQALAELARQRQEQEHRLRNEESLPFAQPSIRENVVEPTVSLGVLVELPTSPNQERNNEELPEICIGLTDVSLIQNTSKDIENLISHHNQNPA